MDITINIADMKISKNHEDILITYDLKSGLGITAYDPSSMIGGMLHAKLPLSRADLQNASLNPFMFVDTGISRILNDLISFGANRNNLIIKIAGCSNMRDEDNFFKIGERNYAITKKILWKNNFVITSEDIGGKCSRILSLDMSNGKTYVMSNGNKYEL